MNNQEYKPVIGFEIHVQLATKSKMFGRAANNPDQTMPNVDIDEVNTGQPGTLPVANREAIRLAAMVGLALNCQIDEFSKFDRKHYFYPDLPKGYQISQYDQPISKNGYLDIELASQNPHPGPLPEGEGGKGGDQPISKNGYLDIEITTPPLASLKASLPVSSTGQALEKEGITAEQSPPLQGGVPPEGRGGGLIKKIKRIGITRAHLEEDAGKNIHPEGLNYSLVDYNRAGAPLLEIVTEPDIESGEEARVFLTEIRNIIRYLGASDCDMEKGTMRLEPNISVRKPGETGLPKYKVEVKNINSIKFAQQAIDYEINRQIEILKAGGTPKQVTMGWDEKSSQTVEQRSKEEANDYRYFPDPDLPVLQFSKEYLDELRRAMPELPHQKRQRFKEEFTLRDNDIENLINWKELAGFFEDVVSEIDAWYLDGEGVSYDGINIGRGLLIQQAANWCLGEFSALLNQNAMNPADCRIDAENFAELLKMIQKGEISGSAAKQVFKAMFVHGGDPSNIIEDLNLGQVSDEAAISSAVDKVIATHQKAVLDYKSGEQKSFGFLVGQTMKELKGKGNPKIINELLKKKLSS